MSEKFAARHEPPISQERDTLPMIEQQFLRDQLEALLSSPAVANFGHASGGSELEGEDAAQAEFDTSADERDTEPGVDARLLRDAILAAGKSA